MPLCQEPLAAARSKRQRHQREPERLFVFRNAEKWPNDDNMSEHLFYSTGVNASDYKLQGKHGN